MKTPKVSVVMPVYNGEAYLREAVDSILHQTFPDFELLIINDGSTDGTLAILDQLSEDERVRVLHNDGNQGLTYTRNRGLASSRGAYIAMLDSDDVAHPQRLAKQVAFLNANPDFAMVGSYIDLITPEGQFIRTQCYPTEPECIPSLLLFQNNFAQSSVMLRRSAIPAEGYRNDFPPSEDYDFWVRIASTHKVANLAERLVDYREHPGGISKTKAAILYNCVKQIAHYQLEKFGIEPTTEELELHVKIGLLEVPHTSVAIESAAAWLLKLKQTNNRTGYFPKACFDKIVALKWYETCRQSGQGSKEYSYLLRPSLLNPKQALYIVKSKLKCRFVPKAQRI
ncbi:glycosyltransferase [Pontibacter sp. HSC-14F20]|uniref:glycosyltransferase family 2 protein n=1 Tax=Pontibacter sp. HSC-14F20 TaxID=2864136 RepID=UPI001C73A121|nr:glycosyltransferase [Pontibacter sp. HSC-14F20]MBX0331704.1 glycosyltransferase [Pontibacter sp. HSC-14F20]